MNPSNRRDFKHRLKKKLKKSISESEEEFLRETSLEGKILLHPTINSYRSKQKESNNKFKCTSNIINLVHNDMSSDSSSNSDKEDIVMDLGYTPELARDNDFFNFNFNYEQSSFDELEHITNLTDTETETDIECDSNLASKVVKKSRNSMMNEEEPEVNELRIWAIKRKIPKTHLNELLQILRMRLLTNLPATYETFLATTQAKYIIENMTDITGQPAEFSYLGIENGLQACVNPDLHLDKILHLDFNIDGVKIKGASIKSMWPVLCKVFLKNMPGVYKAFPVLVWYGCKKPKSIDEYFNKFVNELNTILIKGVVIESVKFTVKIRTFICDTPARALIKCTKGHSSFHGCEKCQCIGKKNDRTTVFLNVGEKRTDASFRSFKDLHHHNGVSFLIKIFPNIDFIKQFVSDPMHLVFLGVMLRLFEYWTSGELRVKLSAELRKKLNVRTAEIKTDIPQEFARKMRSTEFFDKFKAIEHKFFLIYTGVFVLKDILSDALYEHFLYLHVAIRMLSKTNAETFVHMAADYLNYFCEKSEELYGPKFVCLNVHNLQHLADDVANTGSNLNDISAFPYESELGRIKTLLKSLHNIVSQYCRRIHEENIVLDTKAKVPAEMVITEKYTGKRKIKTVYYKFQYFSNKHPDSTALLKDGSIVNIIEITKKDNENIYLKVVNYASKKSVYQKPCDSSLLNTYEIGDRIISGSSRTISITSIATKMVKFTFSVADKKTKRTFVIPYCH